MAEKYLFLNGNRVAKFYGPVAEDTLAEARKNFYNSRIYTTVVPKPPHERTLRKWKKKGIMKAIDGCIVDGMCSCVHGNSSWLRLFTQIKHAKKKS